MSKPDTYNHKVNKSNFRAIGESLYRTLISHLPNSSAVLFSKDLKIQIAEGVALKAFGTSRKKLEKELLTKVLPEEIKENIIKKCKEALKGREHLFEWESGYNLYRIYILPVRDENKNIAGGLIMSQNITDFKRIQENLEEKLSELQELYNSLYEQQVKFRTLFEKSIDAIFITDPDLIFSDVNPSLLNTFGYSKKELRKLSLKDLFCHESDYKDFFKNLKNDDTIKDYEAPFKDKDRNKLFCLISISSIKGLDNSIQGYQGIIHDFTKRRKTEEELLRTEKLAITGRMARTIAHEIRNPLTNISLALEQLPEAEDTEEMEVYTEIIKGNVDRVNHLLTEMLDSSKLTTLNLKPESLNEILEETIKLNKDRFKLQQMRIRKEFDKNLPKIKLDKDKMMVAVSNIIVNAIEAMKEGKGLLKMKTFEENGYCNVLIEDNGSGIEEEDLKNLFDPFYTRKKGGMGLGLTSTHNIIKSHNGKINVESEPGKGTRFLVSLVNTNDK